MGGTSNKKKYNKEIKKKFNNHWSYFNCFFNGFYSYTNNGRLNKNGEIYM